MVIYIIILLLNSYYIIGKRKIIFYETISSPVVVIKNIKNKTLKKILEGNIVYLSMYNKSLSDEEVFNRVIYILDNYFYLDVGEKSIILGLLKLSKNPNNETYIHKLISLLEKYYPNSSYKWLGYFILTIILIQKIDSNITNSYYTLQECTNNLFPYRKKNYFYNNLFLYITNYYLSEYYLKIASDFFVMNKFVEAISNLEKIFVRSHINPNSAKKGLLIAMEIFAILDNKLLVNHYFKYLLETKDENYIQSGRKILKKYYND
ncbi:hypothetical protein AB836_00275 [Rickettsiales bacterium (ex Bugula neritina AB1)]|nr:hypothetical protein AB836_00275 [Rickettsiales bacterium (ex Bugula neritina AB1)]